MASAAVMQLATGSSRARSSIPHCTHAFELACALTRSEVSSSKRNVTFLLNLPWGGTAVATLPLLKLPLLTTLEVQRLSHSTKGRDAALQRLSASVQVHGSAVGLYLSGAFLISLAAAHAGLADVAASSKLRLVLQQREVHPFSFVPIEKVVGCASAALVAAAGGYTGAAEVTAATAAEEACEAPLCTLWLLLRLPGGKGGFGALLKKQRRKKRANFSIDACRDLTGRRIRQAQVVTRIKAWMEKKRKEDALVGVLARDTQEKLPEAQPAVSLDAAFLSEQIAQVAEMPDLVARGLQQQMALRKKQEAKQSICAAAPQNRAVYAQLRDAVVLDSEDDQWSDIEADEEPASTERGSSSSSNSSSSTSSSGSACNSSRPMPERTEASCSSRASTDPTSGSSKKASAQPAKTAAATQALMQQLENMRLKAAALEAEERERKAAAAAAAAKAAEAEKAAAAAAERISREAQQLDITRFTSAEDLAKAVDEAVVKEKLRQLGWKCGGRPEERAARLMQLKTVDLANVPKTLLARQPARKA